MVVSGHLHTLTTLTSDKEPLVPITQDAVFRQCGYEKNLWILPGIKPYFLVFQPVT
jgi:hypothetical protein